MKWHTIVQLVIGAALGVLSALFGPPVVREAAAVFAAPAHAHVEAPRLLADVGKQSAS